MPNKPTSLPCGKISGISISEISKRTMFFTEVVRKLQETEVETEYYAFLKRVDTVGKHLSSEYPEKSKSQDDIRAKIALRIAEVIVSGDLYDMTEGNASNAAPLVLAMNLNQLKQRYSNSKEKLGKMRDGLIKKFHSNLVAYNEHVPLPDFFIEIINYTGAFHNIVSENGKLYDSNPEGLEVNRTNLYASVDKLRTFGETVEPLFPLSTDRYPKKPEPTPSITTESNLLRDSLEYYQLITKISSSGLLLLKYGVPESFYTEIMQKYGVVPRSVWVFSRPENFVRKFKLDLFPLIFRYFIIRYINRKYRLKLDDLVFLTRDQFFAVADWMDTMDREEVESMITEFVESLRTTDLVKDTEYVALQDFFHDWVANQFLTEYQRIYDFGTLSGDMNAQVSGIFTSEEIEAVALEIRKFDVRILPETHAKHLQDLQRSYDANIRPLTDNVGRLFESMSHRDAEHTLFEMIRADMMSISGVFYQAYGSLFSILHLTETFIQAHPEADLERLGKNVIRLIIDQRSTAANRRLINLFYILGYDLLSGNLVLNPEIDRSGLPPKISGILVDIIHQGVAGGAGEKGYVHLRNRLNHRIESEVAKDTGFGTRINRILERFVEKRRKIQ